MSVDDSNRVGERDPLKESMTPHRKLGDISNGECEPLVESMTSYSKLDAGFHDEKMKPKEVSSDTYTIQEAIDYMGFGLFQIKVSALAGLCWTVEAFEIMLLAILGPILSCQWRINAWQQAFLSSLVLVGMAVGNPVWGSFCDKIGRKTCLVMASVHTVYYGILTALSPNYVWVAIGRFIIGFFLGCGPQALTLYSEFLPTKSRALCIVCIEVSFALGASVEVLLAKMLVPSYGWRVLFGASAMPTLIFTCASYFLPESVRFCLASGRYEKATQILDQISRENKKPLPPGQLCPLVKLSEKRGRVRDLYKRNIFRLSLLVQITWLFTNGSYYGIALLLPTLFTSPDGCHGNDILVTEKESCSSYCVPFTDQDYNALAFMAFGDFPGLILVSVAMLWIGRKTCLAIFGALFGVAMMFANLCMSRTALTGLLFMARAMVAGIQQTIFVYAAEVYPTHIRSVAIGIGCGIGRIGSLSSPLLSQVGTQYSAHLGITGFGILGCLICLFACLLPIETKGRSMKDEDESQSRP